MLDSLLTLLTSKRSMVAVLTALFDVLVLFGLSLDPVLAEQLAVLITTLGGVLIAGISASDTGKALGQPAGTDHKGRGLALVGLLWHLLCGFVGLLLIALAWAVVVVRYG